jgi:hypothetical protein
VRSLAELIVEAEQHPRPTGKSCWFKRMDLPDSDLVALNAALDRVADQTGMSSVRLAALLDVSSSSVANCAKRTCALCRSGNPRFIRP